MHEASERMRCALQAASDAGCEAVALWGAGRHTEHVLGALLNSPVQIAGLIDDEPRRPRLLGWPVVATADVDQLSVDAAVINTNVHEADLWVRREQLELRGIRVFRCYGDVAPLGAEAVCSVGQVEQAMLGAAHLPREAVQTYWASRGAEGSDASNHPADYASNVLWSVLLCDWIRDLAIPTDSRVLELGCNIGRNLAFLRYRGFTDLHAIELNANAVEMMGRYFPDTARSVDVRIGSFESVTPALADSSYDLVFSTAVFEHVHSDSEFVFDHIARIARQYVITFENEQANSPRHFRRNYGEVFTQRGLRQIRTIEVAQLGEERVRLLGLEREYVGRIFTRDPRPS